ncbi:unnamed protein product [Rotaria magnacalcarata]|uniref:Uncharacterized protein n=1 Tax=Rotaria magnacalcarata TaxID=392030 RepID=A0A8S2M7P0_9BILA|nr:unnamed protein product [Rotaria magnacalcarata]
MEAIFRSKIRPDFSGEFLPSSGDFRQELIGNHRKKFEKFPTGTLLPQNQRNYPEPAVSRSDKLEEVRLLTIAPAHWGRQRLQNLFDSSERQVRKSLEIRTSAGILSNSEDLRGNQTLGKSVIEAVIKFYEQD